MNFGRKRKKYEPICQYDCQSRCILCKSVWVFNAINGAVFFFSLKVKLFPVREIPSLGFVLLDVPITCVTSCFLVKPCSWFLNTCLEKQHPDQHLAFRQHGSSQPREIVGCGASINALSHLDNPFAQCSAGGLCLNFGEILCRLCYLLFIF